MVFLELVVQDLELLSQHPFAAKSLVINVSSLKRQYRKHFSNAHNKVSEQKRFQTQNLLWKWIVEFSFMDDKDEHVAIEANILIPIIDL